MDREIKASAADAGSPTLSGEGTSGGKLEEAVLKSVMLCSLCLLSPYLMVVVMR